MRPVEAAVSRGGINLIIRSLETNKSFSTNIIFQLWLSDGSESSDRPGTCSALVPSWIFGEQNRKIQQRHEQPGIKKLHKRRRKWSPEIEESEKDDNPTRLSKLFNHGTKVKTSLIFFLCIFRTRKWPRYYSNGDRLNGTQQGPTYLAECVRRRQFSSTSP